MCVSADPKRTRLESPANTANGNLVNGNTASHATNDDTETASTSNVVPTPQALYKNINVTSAEAIRPQALYMNMNFCSDSPNTSTSNTPSLSSGGLTSGGSSSRTDSNLAYTSQASGTSSIIPSNGSRPRTVNTSSTQALVGTVTSQGMGSLQMNNQLPPPLQTQPGPPPLISSTATPNQASAGSFSNFNMAQPPPYGQTAPSTPQNNSAPDTDDSVGDLVFSNADSNIALPATQIRIGTRKFLPASSVTFKEDGVLFALKG